MDKLIKNNEYPKIHSLSITYDSYFVKNLINTAYTKGIEEGIREKGKKEFYSGFVSGYNTCLEVVNRQYIGENAMEKEDLILKNLSSLDKKVEKASSDVTDLKVDSGKYDERFNSIDKRFDSIDKTLANIEKSTDKIDDISIILTRTDEGLRSLEVKVNEKINDKKEKWKTWLPAIVAGACTIIAAIIGKFVW